MGVNNPFSRSIQQTGQRSDPSSTYESRSFNFNRSVRLSFEWRFGQMNTNGDKRSKKINNDDKGGR